MSEVLIYAVVEGRYKNYADLFKFCCKRAYSQYDVQVEEIKTPLPNGAACWRFCTTIPGYQYVYITDIDMMICPEKPTLLEYHLKEIAETGLCYSNTPRWKEPMAENRMTGLHFVTSQWWGVTERERFFNAENVMHGKIGNLKCDDELMLMRIIKGSGLPVAARRPLVQRHHGIHLGVLRDYKKETLQRLRNAVMWRVGVEKAVYWLGLIKEPGYQEIYKKLAHTDSQIIQELKLLEKYCRQIARMP
jgi:hypothetical protein